MSIGISNCGRSYSQQELCHLNNQKACCEIVSCNCQPSPWPAPYNPPAPPAVPPRPYPPDFLPLPKDVAIVTVNQTHTSAAINNGCSHLDIYNYVSASTNNDIASACYNTLMSGKAYTNNRFDYYDKFVSGIVDQQHKIVRYRGYITSSLFDLYNCLKEDSHNFDDWQNQSHYYLDLAYMEQALDKYTFERRKKYQIFNDLRIGDLFIVPVSSALSTVNHLSDEYICIKAQPLSAAEFEKIGSNNIDDIQQAINKLNQRITDEKNDVLSTINTVSTYLYDYTDTQIKQLESKAAISAYLAEENAVSRSKIYTDEEISKLGKVFNIRGFMPGAVGITELSCAPYDYLFKVAHSQMPGHAPGQAEDIAKTLRKGDVFLNYNLAPISCIAEHVYLTSSIILQDAFNPENWEKLGTNSGYALSADVKTLVEQTSALTLNLSEEYTDLNINILEEKAALSCQFAAASAYLVSKNYTDIIAISTYLSAQAYTNAVSSAFAQYLSGDLSGVMVYIGHVCNHPECSGKFPWEIYQEIDEHHHISAHLAYPGHIYETDIALSGTDENGNVQIIKTVKEQFIYLGGPASSITSYKQLGNTTQLNKYSTVDYVKNIENSAAVSAFNAYLSAYNDSVLYTDIKSQQLSTYIQETSSILEKQAALSAWNAFISATIYADNLSAAFTSALISSLINELSGTMIYQGYAFNQHKELQPWHIFASPIYSPYLRKPYEGYVYIADKVVSGTNDFGKVQEKTIVQNWYMYVGNIPSAASSYTQIGYTTQLNQYSTLNYVNNVVSASLANADIKLDNKIDITAENASAYTRYVSGLLEASAAASTVFAITSATTLISETSSITLASAQAYTNTVSTMFADILTGRLVEQLTGTMIYHEYACDNHYQTPWEHAAHYQEAFVNDLYYGSVYIVNEDIKYWDKDNNLATSVITAQYMYIGETAKRAELAKLSTSWLKLGYTVSTDQYATIKLVNDISSYICGLVDFGKFVDNTVYQTILAASATAYNTAKADIYNTSSFISTAIGDGFNSANTVLNTINAASTNAYEKAYTSAYNTAKADIYNTSSFISTAIGNGFDKNYTVLDSINNTRTDLSSYVETTSSNIIHGISGRLIKELTGTMIYHEYAHNVSGFYTQTPWEHAEHDTIFRNNIYYGSVYIVNEQVQSYNLNDELVTSVITAQYMYIGETIKRDQLAKLSTSWLKLGYNVSTNQYATIKRVMNISGAVAASAVTFDTKINVLSSDLDVVSTAVAASAVTFDTKINVLSSDLNAVSTAVAASAATFDTKINVLSSDLNAVSTAVAASAVTFDTKINVLSSDLDAVSTAVATSAVTFDTKINVLSSDLDAVSTAVAASAATFDTRINYLELQEMSALIYKGYACIHACQPWKAALSGELISAKLGDIYIANINVNNKIEKQQFIYLGNDLTLESSWLKVGFTTDLTNYYNKQESNEISSNLINYTDNQINIARIDLSSYTDNQINIARIDLSSYIDTEISTTRSDLSGYVETTSGNLVNYTNQKVSALGNVFSFKGYPISGRTYEYLPIDSSVKIGDVYLIDQYVSGATSSGTTSSIIETAEYVCITSAIVERKQKYQKLGIKTSVDSYATKLYVDMRDNTVSSYICGFVDFNKFINKSVYDTIIDTTNTAKADAINAAAISAAGISSIVGKQNDQANVNGTAFARIAYNKQNISILSTNLSTLSGDTNAISAAIAASANTLNTKIIINTNKLSGINGTVKDYVDITDNAIKAYISGTNGLSDQISNINTILTGKSIDHPEEGVSGNAFAASAYIQNVLKIEQIEQNNRLNNIENIISGNPYSLSSCLKGVIDNDSLSTRNVQTYVTKEITENNKNYYTKLETDNNIIIASSNLTNNINTKASQNDLNTLSTDFTISLDGIYNKDIKSVTAYVTQEISGKATKAEVGTSADLKGQHTVYGYIKLVSSQLSDDIEDTNTYINTVSGNLLTDINNTNSSIGTKTDPKDTDTVYGYINTVNSNLTDTIKAVSSQLADDIEDTNTYINTVSGNLLTDINNTNNDINHLKTHTIKSLSTAVINNTSDITFITGAIGTDFTNNNTVKATINAASSNAYTVAYNKASNDLQLVSSDIAKRVQLDKFNDDTNTVYKTIVSAANYISERIDLTKFNINDKTVYNTIISAANTTYIKANDDLVSFKDNEFKQLSDKVDVDKVSESIQVAKIEAINAAAASAAGISTIVGNTTDAKDINGTVFARIAYNKDNINTLSGIVDDHTNKLTGINTTVVDQINKEVNKLGKVFNFKGYAPSGHLPAATSSTIGDVYLIDEIIDDMTETAQYVGISSNIDQQLTYSWQKLGIKTSVGAYATKVYVDAQDSAISSLVTASAYVFNNKINTLSSDLKITSDALAESAVILNNKIIANTDKLININGTVKDYVDITDNAIKTYISGTNGLSDQISNINTILTGRVNHPEDGVSGNAFAASAYIQNVLKDEQIIQNNRLNNVEYNVNNLSSKFITSLDGIYNKDIKSVTAYVEQQISGKAAKAEVGTSSDLKAAPTVYGYIKSVSSQLANDITDTNTYINTVNSNLIDNIKSVSGQLADNIKDTNTYINTVSGNIVSTIKSVSGQLADDITDTNSSIGTKADPKDTDTVYGYIKSVSGNLLTDINNTNSSIGTKADPKDTNTVYGYINTVNSNLIDNIKSVSGQLADDIEDTNTYINTVSGNLLTDINNTNSLIGAKTDPKDTNTVYSYINTVNSNLVDTIKSVSSQLADDIEDTNTYINTVSGNLLTDINSVDNRIGKIDAQPGHDTVYSQINYLKTHTIKPLSTVVIKNTSDITFITGAIGNGFNSTNTVKDTINAASANAYTTAYNKANNDLQLVSSDIAKHIQLDKFNDDTNTVYKTIVSAANTTYDKATDAIQVAKTEAINAAAVSADGISTIVGKNWHSADENGTVFARIAYNKDNINTLSGIVDDHTIKLAGIDSTVTGYVTTTVTQKVSSLGQVFTFKGKVASNDLPSATAETVGWVYLMDVTSAGITQTRQYVGVSSNTGYKWQQLGIKTSIGSYATKEYVDAQDIIISTAITTSTTIITDNINYLSGQINNKVASALIYRGMIANKPWEYEDTPMNLTYGSVYTNTNGNNISKYTHYMYQSNDVAGRTDKDNWLLLNDTASCEFIIDSVSTTIGVSAATLARNISTLSGDLDAVSTAVATSAVTFDNNISTLSGDLDAVSIAVATSAATFDNNISTLSTNLGDRGALSAAYDEIRALKRIIGDLQANVDMYQQLLDDITNRLN